MKILFKFIATVLLLAASFSALAYYFWYKPKFSKQATISSFKHFNETGSNKILLRLKQKADDLAIYAKAHGYNTEYCFMADMKIESGKSRFFVYNIKKDSIEMAGLVAHGSGRTYSEEVQFSNAANSLCTSLGKYKIGGSYMGKFGLAFKLYGLDATNDNAFSRAVVLHAHSCVPNEEIAPIPICQSWGCPTVAPAFLMVLKTYIDNSEKPVLLYVYF
ncbi:MAG: murein L,D-transpeptidase catalytic domain-containing protein [Ferruginibacter sp.]